MSTSKRAQKPWYKFPWIQFGYRKLVKKDKARKVSDDLSVLQTAGQDVAPGLESVSNEKNPLDISGTVSSPESTATIPVTETHPNTIAPPVKDPPNDDHPVPNPAAPEEHLPCSISPELNSMATESLEAAVCSPEAGCTSTYSIPTIKMPNGRDVVTMVVMGPTGVGKTTFINSFKDVFSLGDAGHHDLDSGTKKMETITVNLQETGKSLVLVDTPGFDDPLRSNAEILSCIAEYLEDMYRKKKLLDGIIYLHRITDIRLDAGASEALNIFKRMYGNEGYDKIGLVTTMWNDIVPGMKHKYEGKERELMGSAWAPFLMRDKGKAHVCRYDASDGDTTKLSALGVVTGIMENSVPQELKLRIQRELVDEQKKLPRTEAGKAAFTLAETAKYYLKELSA